MPELPAVPRPADLARAVEQAFEDGGPLSRKLPGFEPRQAQREMAGAVSSVLERGGVLLAEAGTGTGKTLAYLIPAVLSRQRVLISTGTKTLQEQIFFKDLPAVRDALGVPFKATYMKGRGNYLCLHRFESFRESANLRSTAERMYVTLINEWAARTETGDRGEVEELPDDLPFWSDIAATNENCLGTPCPRYQDCFVTRMRQRAAESDLVIVNHHLLCADAAVRHGTYGEVIPDCRHAVIDEAHQLEDVATQYFGLSASNYRIEELVRDAERQLAGRPAIEPQKLGELVHALSRLRDRGRIFFEWLPRCRPPQAWNAAGAEDRVRVTARMLEPAAEAAHHLLGALDNLQALVALLRDPPEDLIAIGRRAGELHEELAFLLRADDSDYVYYLELRGRGVFLRASPIDVSNIIRDLLLDRMHATVLTSATLSVGGSFEYLRGRLGIRQARELRLPSEFDFERQAVLYLPRRMPDPRSAAFPQWAGAEILQILNRTKGRAFVLFTSYAVLHEVLGLVARAIDYPVFVQGQAPRSALLRNFRETPHSVLFATSSFWQGVDVIGEALSCVIVDKLPFASPSDPITAARIEAIRARGGEPFGDYQVPLAILALLQGLGRLLRHRNDRGVLAILDPRIQTKGYGRRFLESLPPAPITSELDAIEHFFQLCPDVIADSAQARER